LLFFSSPECRLGRVVPVPSAISGPHNLDPKRTAQKSGRFFRRFFVQHGVASNATTYAPGMKPNRTNVSPPASRTFGRPSPAPAASSSTRWVGSSPALVQEARKWRPFNGLCLLRDTSGSAPNHGEACDNPLCTRGISPDCDARGTGAKQAPDRGPSSGPPSRAGGAPKPLQWSTKIGFQMGAARWYSVKSFIFDRQRWLRGRADGGGGSLPPTKAAEPTVNAFELERLKVRPRLSSVGTRGPGRTGRSFRGLLTGPRRPPGLGTGDGIEGGRGMHRGVLAQLGPRASRPEGGAAGWDPVGDHGQPGPEAVHGRRMPRGFTKPSRPRFRVFNDGARFEHDARRTPLPRALNETSAGASHEASANSVWFH